MAASSQLGTMRAALKALLIAREIAGELPGGEDVAVNSFEPGEDDKLLEHIWFENANIDRTHETKDDSLDAVDLGVVIRVEKPGDGDTVAASVEDRALALFAEVEDVITDDRTLSSSVSYAEVTRYEVRNTGTTGNRSCTVTVVVSARSEVTAA